MGLSKQQIPDEVKTAFEAWMKANRWTATLTRSEQGRLGAAKRTLNIKLRKHALAFDAVAQEMI